MTRLNAGVNSNALKNKHVMHLKILDYRTDLQVKPYKTVVVQISVQLANGHILPVLVNQCIEFISFRIQEKASTILVPMIQFFLFC